MYGLFQRFARRNPLLVINNVEAQLWVAKLHLKKPQELWNIVLWIDETKVEVFGHNTQHHF